MQTIFCIFIFAALLQLAWTQSTSLVESSGGRFTLKATQSLLNTPWGNYITPAPVAVCLLGQLNLLSSREGIPNIRLTPPRAGFKYVNHPDSFRASLSQLGNWGIVAFQKAGENMNRIAGRMDGLPRHYADAIDNARHTDALFVKDMIDVAMDEITRSTRECLTLANQTSMEFTKVQYLMQELLESSTATQGTVEEELAAARALKDIQEKNKEYNERMIKFVDTERNKVNADLKVLQKSYDEAMDSIPTGWEILGQQIVKSLANTLISLGTAAANVAMVSQGGMGGAMVMGQTMNKPPAAGITDAPTAAGAGQIATAPPAGSNDITAALNNDKVMTSYTSIQEQLSNLVQVAQSLFDPAQPSPTTAPGTLLSTIKTQFTTLRATVGNAAQASEKSRAFDIIDEATQIVTEIEALTANALALAGLKEGNMGIVTRLKAVNGRMMSLVLDSQSNQNRQNTQNSVQVQDPATYQGDGGLEKYKATLALQALESKEAASRELFNQQLDYERALMETMNKLIDLSKQVIDFAEIARVIGEAMKIIAQIQQQWVQLVEFFVMVTGDIEWFTNELINPLAKKAEILMNKPVEFDRVRPGLVDLLQKNEQDILQESYALKTITETYGEASRNYIVPALAEIGLLTTVRDPRQQAIESDKMKLQAEQNQEEIKNLVEGRVQKARKFVTDERKRLLAITNAGASSARVRRLALL